MSVIVMANTTASLMEMSRHQETGDPNNGGMDGSVKDGNDYNGQQRAKENNWSIWED